MSDGVSSIEGTANDNLTYTKWKEALSNGIILGQECYECGHTTAAPKAACARCGCLSLETINLPVKGTVFTKTSLNVTPVNFDNSYDVAIVSLGNARIMVHLGTEVAIGDEVEFSTVIETDSRVAPVFQSTN